MLTTFLPIIDTLKGYRKRDFMADLTTGLTIGVLLIPQGMAYALLAGMPVTYGLYAGLVPPVFYAIFGTSPHLSVGPVAISSILLLAGVSRIAEVGTDYYISLVITVGLLVGLIEVAMGFLKLGFFVDFISFPVLSGFISAAAIIIMVTQLPDILGIDIPRFDHGYDTFLYAIRNIDATHMITLAVFAASTGLILLIKRLGRLLPSGLIVMVLATLLCYLLEWNKYGLSIIGAVPSGLPRFIWPDMGMANIIQLMPTVLTMLVVGIVGSLSMARAIETKYQYYEVRGDQEMLGLGMAKIAGAFFQSLPVDGSFSRSSIMSETGGRTVLSSVYAAVLVGLTLMFFTSFLYYLPLAVLSAVIVVAVSGLIEFDQASKLWRSHRSDFMMMLITFVVTLLVGIMEGVLCGVVMSIFVVLYRSTHPSVVELGQIDGTTRYRNLDRYEEASGRDDIVVVRFDDQIFFANASFFKESIRMVVNRHPDGKVKHLILDSSNIHSIDSTGIRTLKEVEQELDRKGIILYLSGAIGPVRDILYKSNLLTEPDKHHMTIHEAVQFISKHSEIPQVDYSRGAMQTNVVRRHKAKRNRFK